MQQISAIAIASSVQPLHANLAKYSSSKTFRHISQFGRF